MLSTFNPLTTTLTWFVALNWILTATTLCILIYVYLHHRYLLVKPSLLLIYFSHAMLQWPLTLYSGYYETWFPNPYGAVALVHGFVFIGLAGTLFLFRETARKVWDRLGDTNSGQQVNAGRNLSQLRMATYILFGVTVFLAAVYFFYVPLECTGIYTLIVNPDVFLIGRQISLALLADPVPRYALTLIMASAAPLLTATVTSELINRKNAISYKSLGIVIILFATWALASLNGGKANLVYLSLVIVATLVWQRQLQVSFVRLPLMLGSAMVPAVVFIVLVSASPFKGHQPDFATCFQKMRLTVSSPSDILPPSRTFATLAPPSAQLPLTAAVAEFQERARKSTEAAEEVMTQKFAQLKILNENVKESKPVRLRMNSAYLFAEKYLFKIGNSGSVFVGRYYLIFTYYLKLVAEQASSILFRAIVAPFEVGGWYIHHLETKGPLGLAAIPRLAKHLELEVINTGNMIGLTYGPEYYGHDVSPTINAGSGFIFNMFADFGYWAIVINAVLLFMLDSCLLIYSFAPRILVLPLLAASTPSILKFIEADYGPAWISHGFGIIMGLGLILTFAIRFADQHKAVADA